MSNLHVMCFGSNGIRLSQGGDVVGVLPMRFQTRSVVPGKPVAIRCQDVKGEAKLRLVNDGPHDIAFRCGGEPVTLVSGAQSEITIKGDQELLAAASEEKDE